MAEQPPVVAQQLVQQLLVLAELPHSSWLYFMMISMLSVLYGIPAYRCEEPVRNDLYPYIYLILTACEVLILRVYPAVRNL